MGAYETELICDLAETYGIYEYRRLPARTVAGLVAGLGDESRLKKKITGVNISLTDQLLAIVADRLGILITAYGGKVESSIHDALMGTKKPQSGQSNSQAFTSVEEFNKARYGG